MKIYFGKISTKYDTDQIDGGYYQAPKNSTWFNGIELGDYAFVIGGNKIQLWKAKEWGEMLDGANDKLDFEILIANTGIETKDLIAFKYFKLSIDLIVKSTRSTGAEKKAFFELEIDPGFTEVNLLDPETYKDQRNYRGIRTFLPGQEVKSSYDIQMQFEKGQLFMHPVLNCHDEIVNRFKDNTKHIGYGQSQKDRTLSVLKAISNTNSDLSNKVTIKDLFDACMCPYKVENQETKFWVVNGFKKENIEYDLENNSYVMYFQYDVQKKGEVTKQLRTAKKIKPGDKVLLYNKNKYYGHSTFEETDLESTLELTLNNQISNAIKNDPEQIVTYTDAKCFYEDLTAENGFNGEWGQRLNIQEWEDIHGEGVSIPGIAENLGSSSIVMDTIIELKDRKFYDIVKGILSGEIENINAYKKMKETINLIQSKKQVILQGPPGTGKTYSAKDFAEQLIYNSISSDKKEQKRKLEESGQFSLVQFHPSYSYEDFVRGISAKSEGGNIVYETENKILATFAQKAMNNLNEVNKDVKELSKEQQIEKLLLKFADKVQDKIDTSQAYTITPAVSILIVENDAFRYSGDWKVSQRMKFSDLVLAQKSGVTTRQELKQLPGVSGLAKHHASYFIKVLNNFQKEYKAELKKSTGEEIEKPLLKNYILIIDEINRANLPSVLGELIYALEYRNESVESMYALDGDNSITIPENLYIIGTMNTADRSVGHIDYAIKRRFAFVDVLPREDVINNDKSKKLFKMVAGLFLQEKDGKKLNSDFLASDFDYKDVQLGHSYFILKEGTAEEQKSELAMRLKYEITPILNEYVKDGLLLEIAKEKIKEIANFEC